MPALVFMFLAGIGGMLRCSSAAAQEVSPVAPVSAQTETEAEVTGTDTELPAASGQGLKPPSSAELARVLADLPENAEFPGIKVGSFLMFPEISAAILHDDNIYGERRGENSDFVTIFSPVIALESAWSQHWLQLDAGADIDRYHDFPQESVEDYWIGADGRLDISRAAKLFGGARWARDHEDRAEPDALSPFVAAEPTRYEQASADLGLLLRSDSMSLRVGGTFDRYDFKDVPSVLGPTINKDDRDRDMYSLGARLKFRTSRTVDIFAQYATDSREYKMVPDDFGFLRDSEGYRAAAGLRLRNARRTLITEFFAGWLSQDYQDPAFEDVGEPYFGADLIWRPTPRITLTGFIDRALEESTIPGVSGYFDTAYGLRAERRLTKNFTVNGRFAYVRSEFRGSDRLDKIIDAGAGLRYFVSRTVYLAADYRLIDRNSNETLSTICCQYARDQVMLSVGVTPGRSATFTLAPEAGESGLKIAEPGRFTGFYIGAMAGYGSLHTVTEGARGESGTDVGQMGDDGGSFGVFAGIGMTTTDRWYVGLEAEAEASKVSWYHQKDKLQSRTAYVQKHGGYGIGLRAGRVLKRGQLLFARVMGVRSEFHSYYTQNNFTEGAYDQTEDVSGLRLGFGVDIPAGDNLFVRLDYAYTDYESYSVPYLSTGGISTESFNNEENVARLGLGWQFGARLQSAATAPEKPISGFYAGAQLGPATLETRLDGYHREQGSLPQSFVGDFADQGWAPGAFFGYGFSVRRWYLGAELEANTSDATWEHIREVSGGGGRDFSVEKKSDYGLSLRLGYSLRGATLLYARVGAVRGRFNTAYEKGPNTAFYIDRTDTVSGVRTGFGAEVPVSQVTFLRVDFTHTNYESYSFVTAHGGGANADEMNFNNSENMFRLGLGFRF
ncbi:MAG: outer membrane beta-barrel protein [Betaproteobacteria bacterium]|nr:MAG: outer membrane beta-barrel protein [Betaproteobacteria bacterium]